MEEDLFISLVCKSRPQLNESSWVGGVIYNLVAMGWVRVWWGEMMGEWINDEGDELKKQGTTLPKCGQGEGGENPAALRQGVAKWRPMVMDYHGSCGSSNQWKVNGAKVRKVIIIIIIIVYYYYCIMIIFVDHMWQLGDKPRIVLPRKTKGLPGDDKSPGSSIVEGNRC